jgi:hypothetical protein
VPAPADIPIHWAQALRGKSALFTQAEALTVLGRSRSTLFDAPCECEASPGTYEYRVDKKQHCLSCDGLAA